MYIIHNDPLDRHKNDKIEPQHKRYTYYSTTKKEKQKSLMTIRNDIINIINDKNTFKTLTAHEQPHNVTQHHINKKFKTIKTTNTILTNPMKSVLQDN